MLACDTISGLCALPSVKHTNGPVCGCGWIEFLPPLSSLLPLLILLLPLKSFRSLVGPFLPSTTIIWTA